MAILSLLQTVVAPFAILGAVVLGLYLLWRWREKAVELARALGIRSVSAFGITATVTACVDKIEQKALERLKVALTPAERQAFEEKIHRLLPFASGRRVLWVDDNPAGNATEQAALTTLGVEVFMVRTTDAAMEELALVMPPGAHGGAYLNPYHLVISDWAREPIEAGEGGDAALVLIKRMTDAGLALPVIVYHGPVSRELAAERLRLTMEWPQVAGCTADPRDVFILALTELARPRPMPGRATPAAQKPTAPASPAAAKEGNAETEATRAQRTVMKTSVDLEAPPRASFNKAAAARKSDAATPEPPKSEG